MPGSNIFFAGSIQSISRAASPQKPSGSASERAWTSWYRLLWMFMALLPGPTLPIIAGLVPGIHVGGLVDKSRRGWPDGPGHDKDQFQAIFLKAIFTWSGVNSRPDRP